MATKQQEEEVQEQTQFEAENKTWRVVAPRFGDEHEAGMKGVQVWAVLAGDFDAHGLGIVRYSSQQVQLMA